MDHMADDFDMADAFHGSLIIDNTDHYGALVRQNFDRYMSEYERLKQKDILQWWKSKKVDYPYLSQVARTLLWVKV